MSVLLDTSLGEIVVDLYTQECPLTTKNFLKLCKIKYYNQHLIFNVQENYMFQTGDPTGTGQGGTSVYGLLYGDQARTFQDEIHKKFKHTRKGLLAMANAGSRDTNTSQFYITTSEEPLMSLDEKHTIFGEVAEGMDVVDAINQLYVDDKGRPYRDIRIKHTFVLDDPFPDPPLLSIPDASPIRERPVEETVAPRLGAHEKIDEFQGRTEEEIEKSLNEKEAKSRAVVLEMIGDIPDAEVKPPEEVIFVAKLNHVTTSEDLELIFSRFGSCKAEVIKDYKTGDSLCYGFVEFTKKEHCEEAFFKMNNVLIDDRRIKVDFSQSVSKLWNKFKRRPWENHSKDDGDPYAMEQKSSEGKIKSDTKSVGKNLYLKGQQLGSRQSRLGRDEIGGSHPKDYELLSESNDEDEDDVDQQVRRKDRKSYSDKRRDRSNGGSQHRQIDNRSRKEDHGKQRERGVRKRSRSRCEEERKDENERSGESRRDRREESHRHHRSTHDHGRSAKRSRSRSRDRRRR